MKTGTLVQIILKFKKNLSKVLSIKFKSKKIKKTFKKVKRKKTLKIPKK